MDIYCDPSSEREFQTWLESRFKNVRNGNTSTLTNGEYERALDRRDRRPYIEFFDWTICRNSELDIRVAKEQTWNRFNRRVRNYLETTTPDMTLFWRIVPEEELIDTYVIIRYDDNGPDKDFIIDKRCFADKNWKSYKIYARFVIEKE